MEIRVLATELEIRESQEGSSTKTISGYAVKWEQLSEKLGYATPFREKFLRGAFADSLKADKQKMLWNHNTDMVLGSTKSGTLRVIEDEIGLRFENDLPESAWGQAAYQAIKRGDVEGVSFGFKTIDEAWADDPDNLIRSVTKAKLFEVSPTPFPAYPQSEVAARNTDTVYAEYREALKPPEPVTVPVDDKLAEQRKELSKARLKLYEEVTQG